MEKDRWKEQLSLTPLSSISVISGGRKDIGQGQYARDQVYSVKNSAASGIQTHHRFVKEKSVFSDFSNLFLLVHKYVSSSKY